MKVMKMTNVSLRLRRTIVLVISAGLYLSTIQHHHDQQQRCRAIQVVDAFNVVQTSQQYQQRSSSILYAKVATSKVYSTAAVALVPLVPEPLGGINIEPLIANSVGSSLGISKMKQLSALPSDPKAYQFWMTTYADAKMIQEIRQTILKDASKKANFPGFRKGQVPPYAQPQITQFAIQESIIKTVEAMVSSYGLISLSGSNGQVQVHEDVSEMTKLYKTGTSIQFTATLNAMYDPSKDRTTITNISSSSSSSSSSDTSSSSSSEASSSVMVDERTTTMADEETDATNVSVADSSDKDKDVDTSEE